MIRVFSLSPLLATIALTLNGCSSFSSPPQYRITDPSDLLVDAYFVDGLEELPSIDQPNLFELPARYQRDLDRIIAATDSEYERYSKMRSWLYRHFRDYEFDVTETYSLGQLNTNRKINCLSFSVMFVAAARYVDVPANFQLVLAPPYWDKDGSNWINNQHINVTGSLELDNSYLNLIINSLDIGDPRGWTGVVIQGFSNSPQRSNTRRYTADINPAVLSINSGRKRITEQQVVSLFYSNKSIEALLDRDLPLAYVYTKRALEADPDSSIAWNNLGVVYARVGQQGISIAAYERSVELDDKMYSAKSNLANSYRANGQEQQAALIEQEIESFRNQNPYYHSALAESSIAAGDLDDALDHLQEAVARKRNEHFFYHQLAIVNQQMGDREAVIENLNRARRYARGSEKIRFAGKLKALEEIAVLSR
ncbi:MAG: tetratricopeptide repeat protein [Gammaproteobacteria bacterium]|nr:tetratricopeptide repeat protein [Gammaproteobacteria bacterium]